LKLLEVDLKEMNQYYKVEMMNTHEDLDIEIKPVKQEFEDLKYELIILDEELQKYAKLGDKYMHDK